MSFNLSPLDFVFGCLLCLFIWVATKCGRRFRRWLRELLKQKRGPRSLIPKSPADCPLCNTHSCHLPQHRKTEILPWPQRKSRRGRPKTTITSGFACLNPCYAKICVETTPLEKQNMFRLESGALLKS